MLRLWVRLADRSTKCAGAKSLRQLQIIYYIFSSLQADSAVPTSWRKICSAVSGKNHPTGGHMNRFKVFAFLIMALCIVPLGHADQAAGGGDSEMMCSVVSVDEAGNQVVVDHNGKQHTLTLSEGSTRVQDLKAGDSVHVKIDPNDESKAVVHKE
jgi:hypothetical protein